MDEMVVLDDVTRFGLRRVHVLAGQPVDRERWVARAREAAEDEEIVVLENVEKELGIHHLWVCWPAREVVDFSERHGVRLGVLWRVGRGQTLREAAELAVSLHLGLLGSWPERVAVRKRPAGSGERLDVCGCDLELVEWGWLGGRVVFVEGGAR